MGAGLPPGVAVGVLLGWLALVSVNFSLAADFRSIVDAGKGNELVIDQADAPAGASNTLSISIAGDRNIALRAPDLARELNVLLDSDVVQHGGGNAIDGTINGSDNRFLLTQAGSENSLTVRIAGQYNSVQLEQFGTDNSVAVHQSGHGNSVSVVQR